LRRYVAKVCAALGLPSGIAFVVLAVPGPCTSFNDLDAAFPDAGEDPCTLPLNLAFAFEDDTGVDAAMCSAYAASECRAPEQACANSCSTCGTWLACAQDCGCINRCGTVPSALLGVYDCAAEAGLPFGCMPKRFPK
jgi:hypothetical protein